MKHGQTKHKADAEGGGESNGNSSRAGTFCTASAMTLFVFATRDTLELMRACLLSRRYSELEWSLMPSMNENRSSALNRPRRRSYKLLVLIVPLPDAQRGCDGDTTSKQGQG